MTRFLLVTGVALLSFSFGSYAKNEATRNAEWQNYYNLDDFKGFEIRNLDTYQFEKYAITNLDISVFATLFQTPQKTHVRDEFSIETTTPSTLSVAKNQGDSVLFNVNGYSNGSRPTTLTKDDISVVHQGALVPFAFASNSNSGKQLVFDLVLDDSGSMSGYKMKRLLNAIQSFMSEVDGKNHLCRITWFSSTYDVVGDYKACGLAHFGSLQTRGEYGGTSVVGALENSYKDLLDFDSQKYITNVLLVGDGMDSSITGAAPKLNTAKALTNTFTYIIDNNTSHNYADISDYVMFQEDEFDKNLFNYMLAAVDGGEHRNTITIDKNDLTAADGSPLKKKL
jgi:uncharacterized protein YegL